MSVSVTWEHLDIMSHILTRAQFRMMFYKSAIGRLKTTDSELNMRLMNTNCRINETVRTSGRWTSDVNRFKTCGFFLSFRRKKVSSRQNFFPVNRAFVVCEIASKPSITHLSNTRCTLSRDSVEFSANKT